VHDSRRAVKWPAIFEAFFLDAQKDSSFLDSLSRQASNGGRPARSLCCSGLSFYCMDATASFRLDMKSRASFSSIAGFWSDAPFGQRPAQTFQKNDLSCTVEIPRAQGSCINESMPVG